MAQVTHRHLRDTRCDAGCSTRDRLPLRDQLRGVAVLAGQQPGPLNGQCAAPLPGRSNHDPALTEMDSSSAGNPVVLDSTRSARPASSDCNASTTETMDECWPNAPTSLGRV